MRDEGGLFGGTMRGVRPPRGLVRKMMADAMGQLNAADRLALARDALAAQARGESLEAWAARVLAPPAKD